jgi:hypothetical protein
MACFMVTSWHLPGETKGKHKNPQLGWVVSESRFKTVYVHKIQGSMFLKNTGSYLQVHKLLQPRRPTYIYI